jgi:endoglycosylceramidase
MKLQTVLLVFGLAVCLVALGVADHEQRSDNCCVKVDTTTRQLVDIYGRARIFHGVNVVYKSYPYHPQNSSFDPEFSLAAEDIEFLAESGFTVVRLYVAWPGVEPAEGIYNSTYLDVLEDYVNKLGDAGISTILDCHQDLLSPKFCGEGVPDYAALYMNRSIKPRKFPEPVPSLFPYRVDPDTGYPYRSECNKHSFFTYYFSDADSKSWQSLYDNEQGVQDHFLRFWQEVARKFTGNTYVLGYELLNEPWAGDIYRHPDQLLPSTADSRNLEPMYARLHSAIREYDDQHIIFFEPTIIITSLPFKFSETGLSHGPGGPQYNDRQVLSYHLYCIALDGNGQPLNTRLCDGVEDKVIRNRVHDTEKLGVAGFMTEWGAYDNKTMAGSRPYEDGIKVMGLADEHLQSWAYWQYKGYGDFTTQPGTAEGLWFGNGTLQSEKVKMLSRSYAKAVSGRYVNQTFDPETGDFSVTFTADVMADFPPTVIYVNEKYYYPDGLTVSVYPPESASYSTAHNTVIVSLMPSTPMGEEITVTVKAI